MTALPGSLDFSYQIYIITSPLNGHNTFKIVPSGTLADAVSALSIWHLALLAH